MATLSEDDDGDRDDEDDDEAPHPPTPSPRCEEKGRLVVVCCPAPCGEEMVREVVMFSMLLEEERRGDRLLCMAFSFMEFSTLAISTSTLAS